MMKKLLIGLMLLVVSGAASAEWTDVGDNDEITLYVDKTTIRRNGNLVKMWILYDFKSASVVVGLSFLSNRSQNEYDCKEEKFRILEISYFSGQMLSGKVVISEDNMGRKWVAVPPSSVMEAQWKIACGKE